MDIPPKRKPNRSERRAAQKGAGQPQDDVGGVPAGQKYVPAPPATGCPPWHFYWCDGHTDWHHHDEDAVNAIAQSLAP